mgnify:CR=1 FL=1
MNNNMAAYAGLYQRIAVIYLRLSIEDDKDGESGSITNQRKILTDYCKKNNIIIAREFADDNFSGGNFNRPGFQKMLEYINSDRNINTVITKDLSRLGRDMSESSYYAERYFPEHRIQYIAVHDHFDSEQENMMAPFMFAINDVYLRDGSRKVKTALHTMMDHGEYCHAAPYGYIKDPMDNHKLIPDPNSAWVVKEIFALAVKGYSTWAIAESLTNRGIAPPLKYRVLAFEKANSGNLSKISDTTVKRILHNPVYRGHTMLGRTKKVSPKSEVKVSVPREQWHVTENTHEPLVSQDDYNLIEKCLGKRRKDYEKYEHVRKSIFGGVVYCANCGAAMCSAGSVYKGEREKYWYLSCQNIPKRSRKHCDHGARIKYDVLKQAITDDLNEVISLTEEEKESITKAAIAAHSSDNSSLQRRNRVQQIDARLAKLSELIGKIYEDTLTGELSKEIGDKLLTKYKDEDKSLRIELASLSEVVDEAAKVEDAYNAFFNLTESMSHIDELTPEILNRFIDKIEVEYRPPNSKEPQEVHVYYKFVGKEILSEPSDKIAI